jgi:hypothetical protein
MTELCNVVTRETKEVKNKIGDIEEPNEGINAKETVEEEDAELGVDAAREPNMVMDETAQNANEDKHALKNILTIEVEAVNAKKPELGADVEKVYETAELGKDAASEPIMVLDEATLTAVGDISIDKAEEQDCAAQVATEYLNETADDARKHIMAVIAEETTEL